MTSASSAANLHGGRGVYPEGAEDRQGSHKEMDDHSRFADHTVVLLRAPRRVKRCRGGNILATCGVPEPVEAVRDVTRLQELHAGHGDHLALAILQDGLQQVRQDLEGTLSRGTEGKREEPTSWLDALGVQMTAVLDPVDAVPGPRHDPDDRV